MIAISIKSDFPEISKMLKRIDDDVQKKVVPAALNKVGEKSRTEMTRAITSEFNLTAAEVRGRLRLVRAARSVNKWFVILDPFASGRKYASKGTTLNLIRFVEKSVTIAEGRRRKKSGTANQLRFQIKKTGARVTLKGSFIATSKKTGGTAVFTRKGKDRFPIEAKQTIDVPQMFNANRINARVLAKINQELPIEFYRAIKSVLSGAIR